MTANRAAKLDKQKSIITQYFLQCFFFKCGCRTRFLWDVCFGKVTGNSERGFRNRITQTSGCRTPFTDGFGQCICLVCLCCGFAKRSSPGLGKLKSTRIRCRTLFAGSATHTIKYRDIPFHCFALKRWNLIFFNFIETKRKSGVADFVYCQTAGISPRLSSPY